MTISTAKDDKAKFSNRIRFLDTLEIWEAGQVFVVIDRHGSVCGVFPEVAKANICALENFFYRIDRRNEAIARSQPSVGEQS